MPRARAAFTGVSIGASAGEDFGNVVAGDLHLHCAHLDFKMVVVDFADYARGASGGLEFDGVAFERRV